LALQAPPRSHRSEKLVQQLTNNLPLLLLGPYLLCGPV
jgi:hypothetical protein